MAVLADAEWELNTEEGRGQSILSSSIEIYFRICSAAFSQAQHSPPSFHNYGRVFTALYGKCNVWQKFFMPACTYLG
jgi:hypothetical protein